MAAKAAKVPPPALVRMVGGLVNALESAQNKLLPAPVVMLDVITKGMVLSASVCVAAELSLADLMKDGPRKVEELATASKVDASALYRLLRFLASNQIFEEQQDGKFANSRLSDALRADAQDSMRPWALYVGADWYWDLFSQLNGSIRNGKSIYENKHQMRFFEWFDRNPAEGRVFDHAMTSISAMVVPAISAGYDFSRFASLVDIAGGQGGLLAAILGRNPKLKGTLFDQPAVIEEARRANLLGTPELASRAELLGGDFFKAVPEGRDAYMMKWILHDWNDEESLRLLRVIRGAAGAGKTLLVVEMLVEPGNAPSPAKMLDIGMLALTGGKERTAQEYGALFAQAGFKLTRVIPTASPYSIVEATSV